MRMCTNFSKRYFSESLSYPGLSQWVTHIQNGHAARRTARGEQVVIVLLTERLAFSLKEVPRADFLLAVGTRKVLGVPDLAEGRYHLRNCGKGDGLC